MQYKYDFSLREILKCTNHKSNNLQSINLTRNMLHSEEVFGRINMYAQLILFICQHLEVQDLFYMEVKPTTSNLARVMRI